MSKGLKDLRDLRVSLSLIEAKLYALRSGLHYHINESGLSLIEESIVRLKEGQELLKLFDNWDNNHNLENELNDKLRKTLNLIHRG